MDRQKLKPTVLCWHCAGSRVDLHQETGTDTAAVNMGKISASPVNQQIIHSYTSNIGTRDNNACRLLTETVKSATHERGHVSQGL